MTSCDEVLVFFHLGPVTEVPPCVFNDTVGVPVPPKRATQSPVRW